MWDMSTLFVYHTPCDFSTFLDVDAVHTCRHMPHAEGISISPLGNTVNRRNLIASFGDSPSDKLIGTHL